MAQERRLAVPNLRIWRLHALLNARELAEKAGLGRDTIFRLEREGARANEVTVYKIANALNISVRQLLEEVPPEKRRGAA